MCRNIKTLFNFDPPATQEEIRAASLQFVRKLSGFTRPSKANEEVFDQAVEEVAEVAERLIASLVTTAPPRDREEWVARARARQPPSACAQNRSDRAMPFRWLSTTGVTTTGEAGRPTYTTCDSRLMALTPAPMPAPTAP